ncbi:MAG: MarR family transcriptional regulator [Nocardioides sp.]|uniref:MarR family winged helix-turn-helix transcriptional regulator n=1 Tax=Nocardioides sp. TaxID=35761 RepID=UPI002387808E|nr:MarR family transcriptional regulator [Nocardioides sp.]MDE0777229.1 MarR family transcriptional regulator [Nocardioides sp.]
MSTPPPQPALHPALADRPGHLLWRARARVAAATEEEQRAGVDLHAVSVLRDLVGSPGGAPRSQQELADTVGISRTTMVRVAAALVAEGLVQRVRNPLDRRSYALTPTDAGARAVRLWQERTEAVQERLIRGFTDEEREVLAGLLLRVAGAEVGEETAEAVRDDIGFLVGRAHTRMHRRFLEDLAPLNLEPRLFGTLNLLARSGSLTQSEVARHLGISGASVVQIADDLEARGFVDRRRDPTDRRTQRLHLRPGATETLAAAHRVEAATLAAQMDDLSADEVATLVALLQRFVTSPEP